MDSFICTFKELFSLNKISSENVRFKAGKQKLVIPMYQREFAWEPDMVTQLMVDINDRDKFLGIIILDEKSNSYEIVDGQQRITSCYLILMSIFNHYENSPRQQQAIDKFIRPYHSEFILENQTIGNYIQNEHNKLSLCIDDDHDIYMQKEIFTKAFSAINKYVDELTASEPSFLESFYRKLFDSQFLIFINQVHTDTSPIEQIFLDINEKSQKLTYADVFKGHCYRNFGRSYPDELQSYWIRIKKSASKFKKWGFAELDDYIYTYLLLTLDKTLPKSLSKKGKHILSGKSMDDTENLLSELSEYGEHVIDYFNNVDMFQYFFSDVCCDSSSYTSTPFISSLKHLSLRTVTSCKTQYPNLPLFYLIHKLKSSASIKEKFTFIAFEKIVTNLCIYSVLYSYTDLPRAKSIIDQEIYRQLQNQPDNLDIEAIRIRSQELRKETVNHVSFPLNESSLNNLAILYTIMDQFDPRNYRIKLVYNSTNNYNLEHFLVPDNSELEIDWKDNTDSRTFKLSSKYKGMKKRATNYLIMDKDLNRSMHNWDIVHKINHIEEYYRNSALPKHFEIIISAIKEQTEYTVLTHFDETTPIETIKESYQNFLNVYFSEEFDGALRGKLQEGLKSAFQN